MKKLIYIIWAFCLGLQGCEQDPEYEYDDIDRIYFQYEVQNSLGNNVSVDSVVFSFGKLPEEVVADTAKIVVQLMGNVSEQPRKYRVKVLEKGVQLNGVTTMVEGEDYAPIAEEQVFGPNRFQDTLRILVYRKNLSTSLRNPESKTLMLALEEGEDFLLGNAFHDVLLQDQACRRWTLPWAQSTAISRPSRMWLQAPAAPTMVGLSRELPTMAAWLFRPGSSTTRAAASRT